MLLKTIAHNRPTYWTTEFPPSSKIEKEVYDLIHGLNISGVREMNHFKMTLAI
jgi:hypothetical protein